MKTTAELYGIEPQTLKGLPYEKALEEKFIGAQVMMKKYRKNAEKEKVRFGRKYTQWMKKYKASEEAMDFTLKLIDELNGEEIRCI